MAKSPKTDLLAEGARVSNPALLAEDPYLSLNRATEVLTGAAGVVEKQAGRGGSFEPSLLHGLIDAIDKLRRSVEETAKKPVTVKAPDITLPKIEFPPTKEPVKEWIAEIIERDDDGRAKRFKFTAV